MATGEKLGPSLIHASDEVVERPCSICWKENKAVESTNSCVDCNSYMCTSCTKWHEKFPGTSGHQVIDISMATSAGGQTAPLPTERCEEHHDKLLDTYCLTHDQLCCVFCVAFHHGKCKLLLRSLDDVTKQLKKVKYSHHGVLQEIYTEETSSQESLQDMRMMLIKHIENLTKAESDKIKSRYQELRDAVQTDIKAVDDQLDATETCRKKMNDFHGDNENQLFEYIKQAEKNEKNGGSLTEILNGSRKTRIPKYKINNSIQKYLCGVKSLGEFERTVKLTLVAENSVKTAGDSNVGYISGLCVLPNGPVILVDNHCLKQLDRSYKVTRSLDMSTELRDVCYTKRNEVAVTLSSVFGGKVQFVLVGAAMEKTGSFSVDGVCRSICYSQGELFVCCGGDKCYQVCVFTLSGQAIRTIQYDQAGEPLFSVIRYITVSSNGNKLHVTDTNKGVITLDRTGNLPSTYTEPGLGATGICALDDDDLLVTDYNNNTVLHVSCDGKKLGVVLGKQGEIVGPWAVCYDSVNSKVILCTTSSGTIKVYNLE